MYCRLYRTLEYNYCRKQLLQKCFKENRSRSPKKLKIPKLSDVSHFKNDCFTCVFVILKRKLSFGFLIFGLRSTILLPYKPTHTVDYKCVSPGTLQFIVKWYSPMWKQLKEKNSNNVNDLIHAKVCNQFELNPNKRDDTAMPILTFTFSIFSPWWKYEY